MEPRANDGARSRAGRPTSEEAARLTEKLRRAAVDTFLEHGYDRTTMEAVARAAGVTKSTLYGRYPDKRTLFIAVSSWALTRQERDARVLEPLPDDLAASLTLIARAILARSVDPDIVRLSRMAIAESARFPEFAASSQSTTWSPRIQVIIDLLREHERAGAVSVSNVELAAEQFFAMVGAMPAWLAAYGIYRSPELEDRRLQHAVQLFLSGVLTRDPGHQGRPDSSPATPLAGAGHPSPGDGDDDTVDDASCNQTTSKHAGPGREAGAMRYSRLGRSGLDVSRLALGIRAFGAAGGGCDPATAAGLLARYLDAGGNLIDATDASADAAEICAVSLRGRRSQVVLAAGTSTGTGTGTSGGGGDTGIALDRARHGGRNSRRHLRAACDAALRRLGTDYIDLYQLSADDPSTPLEETVEALDDLVRSGKILYVGAADFPAYRIMKAVAASDRLGRARFISLRSEYGPTARAVEREHFPLLAEEGLGFISAPRTENRTDPTNPAPTARRQAAAARLGCTTRQLDLVWQWTRPVASVSVDISDVAQLDELLAAADVDLPNEVITAIDDSTAPSARL
ncbi:aldo/keto reductase [Parafrankia sp. EUN1f]|uniref:aldo/keto reductase n=1 Tax=Parafrankia sp. EUN1f TaxID=102897 RepID=UPI0001C45F10|nr:aldo/keto reductase [Parafrankia sp. EUN1f]EFC81792.1 putative transcriptional regulator, TetR family [Parafrankia sp. EUN1f]